MSDRQPEDRRIAWHEAGHVVVAAVLGHELGPVTIVPTEHYLGVAFHQRAEEVPDADTHFTGALPLMPARMRHAFETEICVTMAGDLAESLRRAAAAPSSPPRSRGYVGRLNEAVDEVQALSPSDESRIGSIGGRPLEADEDRVWQVASAFVGTSSAQLEVTTAFVSYLRAVTRDLLARHWQDVERLAEALLVYRSLSGDAARMIIFETEHP